MIHLAELLLHDSAPSVTGILQFFTNLRDLWPGFLLLAIDVGELLLQMSPDM